MAEASGSISAAEKLRRGEIAYRVFLLKPSFDRGDVVCLVTNYASHYYCHLTLFTIFHFAAHWNLLADV